MGIFPRGALLSRTPVGARPGPAFAPARRALLLLPGLCGLQGAFSLEAMPRADAPRLTGTFIQLTTPMLAWRPPQWQELFRGFAALRLTDIVLQWTQRDEVSFLARPRDAGSEPTPVESVLLQADHSGMRVLVGLHSDSKFWQSIGAGAPALASYLRDCEERSAAVASALAPLVARHASFAGWYLNEEIDDGNWNHPEARRLLKRYLRRVGTLLRVLAPDSRIAISGFAGGNGTHADLGALWADLLHDTTCIDEVMFQDGAGVGRTVGEGPAGNIAAVRAAVRRESRRMSLVIELFRQTGGPPLGAGPFRAEPAPLDRIWKQLGQANAGERTIAFKVPDYMLPGRGAPASALYASYLEAMGRSPRAEP